ncbi:hypothetical protein JWG39_14275 [Desulforhopalus vacuolatus]|uniref:nitrilase-related carbon-nitrogen hydrolase n=1 Tax=Desulforhopalus vacuolatus TaxID=40414 RepID=UPI001964EE07|nr:nitrilase-related carbon-nitrogen hydrolase [Desulforhopalus vacuolatus]MBM9520983.1 hypothetical protein [Desulforhopalus vacuolatus]
MKEKCNRVGFLQQPVVSGEIETNVASLKKALEKAAPVRETMLLLPELWASGFCHESMDEVAAETPSLLQQTAELAARYGIVLAGTFAEVAGEKFYNNFYLCSEAGVAGPSSKQHIFPGEERSFVQGAEPPQLIQAGGLQVGGFICFDLRFPEVERSLAAQGADLLLCSAQWPEMRIDHWLALLKARAIENQIFLVACNGCYESGGVVLGGNSVVISPFGEILAQGGVGQESASVTLIWSEMADMRSRYTSWRVG